MKVVQFDDFQSLKPEWDSLLKNNSVDRNVFLTWDWLSTWWNHFGEPQKPLLLAVVDAGNILGIAPLTLSKHKSINGLTIKKIEFIGVPHSDYHNFIFSKNEMDCLALILNYLNTDVVDWNWIDLGEISSNTITLDLLKKTLPTLNFKLKMNQSIQNKCNYIPLSGSIDLVHYELNGFSKKNLKRSLRKIKKCHKVNFCNYQEFGLSVEEAMFMFFKLHKMRWGEKSLLASSSIEGEKFRAFHIDVAKRFSDNGWLGLYFLSVDDEPVAVKYGFEYENKMYAYLSGFDPDYSNYSVGNLILNFLLERLSNKGFEEYDLLRGSEDYKNYWTKNYRKNFRFQLIRTNLVSKFYYWTTQTRLAKFRHMLRH